METLKIKGKVIVTLAEWMDGKVKLHPANFLELQRVQESPFIQHLNAVLGTAVVEARIPDKTEGT